jgi:hypothetical protein
MSTNFMPYANAPLFSQVEVGVIIIAAVKNIAAAVDALVMDEAIRVFLIFFSIRFYLGFRSLPNFFFLSRFCVSDRTNRF